MKSIQVETYAGPREALRPLFELAEDSRAELDSYLDHGRVLVARSADGEIVGHLQLVDTYAAGQVELKNMAVAEEHQGRGIGRVLVVSALEQQGASTDTVVVATAAADIGNLRFYQRLGFRMRSIERDVFTPATGYPAGCEIDGIELRDRVWLDRSLHTGSTP
jgi:GNAT superfamily N-acetyltransferase